MSVAAVVDNTGQDRILAVISDASPQLHVVENVTVFTLETFDPPMETAMPLVQEWFIRMCEERPWEARH